MCCWRFRPMGSEERPRFLHSISVVKERFFRPFAAWSASSHAISSSPLPSSCPSEFFPRNSQPTRDTSSLSDVGPSVSHEDGGKVLDTRPNPGVPPCPCGETGAIFDPVTDTPYCPACGAHRQICSPSAPIPTDPEPTLKIDLQRMTQRPPYTPAPPKRRRFWTNLLDRFKSR